MKLNLTHAVLALPKSKKIYGKAPSDLLSPDLNWVQGRLTEKMPFNKPWKKFFLQPNTPPLELSKLAIEKLLQLSSFTTKDITGLVSAAFPNKNVVPGDSAYLSHFFKLKGPHINIESACSTGLMAVPAALSLSVFQKNAKVIVVLNNCFSKSIDWNNESESFSFGDAAVALLFEKSDAGCKILNFTASSAQGTKDFWKYDYSDQLKKISFIKLKNSDIEPSYFLKEFHNLVQKSLKDSRTQSSDYQHIFCHANTNLSHLATRSYFNHNIHAYNSFPMIGNVGAVSPWPAFIYADKKKKLKPDELSLLYTIGYGGNSALLALEGALVKSEVFNIDE